MTSDMVDGIEWVSRAYGMLTGIIQGLSMSVNDDTHDAIDAAVDDADAAWRRGMDTIIAEAGGDGE